MAWQPAGLEVVPKIDFATVCDFSRALRENDEHIEELCSLHARAKWFLLRHSWCLATEDSYLGLFESGIIAVFLFRILPRAEGVDEWLWVVVGDLPTAHISSWYADTPTSALDGYLGEMRAWVEAAETGEPVDDLIPVNVPATPEWAEALKWRLNALAENLLDPPEDDRGDGVRA